MSIGLPVKLLHEAQNHVITIEVKSGELYRGYLTEAEVNKNDIGFYECQNGQCYSHNERW